MNSDYNTWQPLIHTASMTTPKAIPIVRYGNLNRVHTTQCDEDAILADVLEWACTNFGHELKVEGCKSENEIAVLQWGN